MIDKNGTGAMRFNDKKPRMSLIDADAMEGLAKVLTFGAEKYDAHNWRKGLFYSNLLDSMLRHVAAIQRGEDYDLESGQLHVDHIMCNAMFLSHYQHTGRTELDDRYKKPTTLQDVVDAVTKAVTQEKKINPSVEAQKDRWTKHTEIPRRDYATDGWGDFAGWEESKKPDLNEFFFGKSK